MAMGKDLASLLLALDYQFTDISLLDCALTHTSYSNEMKAKGIRLPSNERMEFLGDAVLELVISEHIYKTNKKLPEGKLSALRKEIVCERSLFEVARSISLGDYLHLGHGEEVDCRTRERVLADALEAVFGALYLDCALRRDEKYKDIILRLMAPVLSEERRKKNTDYKTALQQFVEQEGSSILSYRTVSEEGPEHSKLFYVAALINNNVVGEGQGKTIKAAEQMAARAALALFGVL